LCAVVLVVLTRCSCGIGSHPDSTTLPLGVALASINEQIRFMELEVKKHRSEIGKSKKQKSRRGEAETDLFLTPT
jgi:hypothetical protein